MKIAVFGATGRTGQAFIEQAIARGHVIHALARSPARIKLVHPRLAVIQGDVMNPSAVETTLAGADAAISTLGHSANGALRVVSVGTQNIINAMASLGIRRLLVMSSLGVGDSKNQVPLNFRIVFALIPVLRRALADHNRLDALVRQSQCDWTLVRAGGLKEGPATGRYTVSTQPTLKAGFITRTDVAAFILRALEEGRFIRESPGVT